MEDEEDEDEEEEEPAPSKEEEEESESKEEGNNGEAREEKRLNGRDKKGMYKNHKNYVNLRNKINQQENGHQQMFDSINEKLSDRSFI